jgi:Arc/MetJ-type ribon-helix-helix transcriptional regulator
MDEKTIAISVSEDEQEFIDGQIAAGHYAGENELLRAGRQSQIAR